MKKKRTKKGRKQTKTEDDEVPEQDIAEQVVTKDQLSLLQLTKMLF